MKNKFNAFKIISVSLISFDLLYVLFFIVWGILVLAKISIFNIFFLILFIIFLLLNIAFVAYTVVRLFLNRKAIDNKKNQM